jgi:hypothetical protein
MEREHPHLGATYKIVRQTDDTFGVKVNFPLAPLVNVTGFATESLAVTWITSHKRDIATGSLARAKLPLKGNILTEFDMRPV